MGPNEVTPLNQNFSACAQKNYFRSASAQREILSAAHSLAERRMSGTQFKKKEIFICLHIQYIIKGYDL